MCDSAVDATVVEAARPRPRSDHTATVATDGPDDARLADELCAELPEQPRTPAGGRRQFFRQARGGTLDQARSELAGELATGADESQKRPCPGRPRRLGDQAASSEPSATGSWTASAARSPDIWVAALRGSQELQPRVADAKRRQSTRQLKRRAGGQSSRAHTGH